MRSAAAAVVAATAASFAAQAAEPADAAALTFGGEARLRYVTVQDARLVPGNDTTQAQFRGLFHADYRVGPQLRFHGEIGTGQVDRDRDAATASLQNRAALQQLYVDIRNGAEAADGKPLFGATIGRQEFAEGPRQLLSVGDGANLRRTWNGVRAYAHAPGYDIALFELRATRLAPGAFDDGIRDDAVLRGAVARIALAHGEGRAASLQPFWLHTTMAVAGTNAGGAGDVRDTLGARLQGNRGRLRWDWTLARQQGRVAGRDVRAWGMFAVQSLSLSDTGWKPRLTSHIDIASRDFHPLYSSSNYLGEGQFLGLTNLLLVAPGIAVSPTARTTLSLEYGHARRLVADEAAHASGMRAYAGTAGVPGHHIGGLARLAAGWTPSKQLSFSLGIEHLATGAVLDRAGLASGTYLQLGAQLGF
jgi:hypothetical protein